MILDILIIVLFTGIFVLATRKNETSTKKNKCPPIPTLDRQQLCGIARVVDDNKVQFIHSGCTIDRKASFDEAVPGASPFGDDGFKWEHENALIGNGYTLGNL
jgi:hypothetical protein